MDMGTHTANILLTISKRRQFSEDLDVGHRKLLKILSEIRNSVVVHSFQYFIVLFVTDIGLIAQLCIGCMSFHHAL